jgi:hypothetical protein
MKGPTSLIDLFSPPLDHIGDFGLICGFTAGRDTVNRIKRRFSPDLSHPKLALLIHPTKVPVTDVPGVIWCHVNHDPRARGFDLLHAKLALLGFRHRETGAYLLRLVISTGNWTHEPLSTSIDCFWSCETTPDHATLDDAADLRRAWDVFQNLRAVTAPDLLQTPFDGHLPDAALREAVEALPQADPSGGRLIDNREGGLLSEFVSRLAKPSPRRRATKVVMGAGYYQSAVGTDFVPKRVLQELVKAGVLERNCRASLIANPESCQSLVERAKWLTSDGWSVYSPEFSKHRQGEPKTPRKLHAKFILLGGDDLTTGPASLYLGSGNLTERGIIDPMSPHGNLEAGVVIRPGPALGWRGNKGTRGLTDLLPIARAEERRAPINLVNAAAGDDFERPEEPHTLPAVTWLIWNEGRLSAPGGTAVRVRRPNGGTCDTPCDGLFPCPEFVTLEDSGLAVPVLSDGVLSTRPRPRSFDEVLKGLRQFPEPPDADEEEDDTDRTDGTGPRPPGVTAGSPLGRADAPERPYPIRRMMRLLVALTDRQRTVLAYDWDRWCRELRSDLSGIAAAEEPTIAFFRCSGVDPLPILLDPLFLPDGAESRRLEKALDEIRAAWGLEGCPSLWDDEDAV